MRMSNAQWNLHSFVHKKEFAVPVPNISTGKNRCAMGSSEPVQHVAWGRIRRSDVLVKVNGQTDKRTMPSRPDLLVLMLRCYITF
jgi:hypothetical protein